jgi:hypothetical protein
MVHLLPPPDSYSILLGESNSTEVNGELIARTERARGQGREDLAQVNPKKSNCGQDRDTRDHNDISLFQRYMRVYTRGECHKAKRGGEGLRGG